MNEKAEQRIVFLVEHNERSSTVKKHLIDVKVIMAALTDSLGDVFKPTMLKTNMILSDNCHAARSTREAIKKELDDKYPVTFERHSQKCPSPVVVVLPRNGRMVHSEWTSSMDPL